MRESWGTHEIDVEREAISMSVKGDAVTQVLINVLSDSKYKSKIDVFNVALPTQKDTC